MAVSPPTSITTAGGALAANCDRSISAFEVSITRGRNLAGNGNFSASPVTQSSDSPCAQLHKESTHHRPDMDGRPVDGQFFASFEAHHCRQSCRTGGSKLAFGGSTTTLAGWSAVPTRRVRPSSSFIGETPTGGEGPANAMSAKEGAEAVRRTASSSAADESSARKARRRFLPPSTGTAAVMADIPAKAMNIHWPVSRARPVPVRRGSAETAAVVHLPRELPIGLATFIGVSRPEDGRTAGNGRNTSFAPVSPKLRIWSSVMAAS